MRNISRHRIYRLFPFAFFLYSSLFFYPSAVRAESEHVFNTRQTTIHYQNDQEMDDFVWRLGGARLEFKNDRDLTSTRIDRIIERVESILDMWPPSFHIDIYLHAGALEAQKNKAAYYEYKTRSIHVSVIYISDGVIAHEIAHAVIHQYFPTPTPSKTQEILAQYVDAQLWNDY